MFHGENGQIEYIVIIFSFTNIVSIVACIDLELFQFIITFPVNIFIAQVQETKPQRFWDILNINRF